MLLLKIKTETNFSNRERRLIFDCFDKKRIRVEDSLTMGSPELISFMNKEKLKSDYKTRVALINRKIKEYQDDGKISKKDAKKIKGNFEARAEKIYNDAVKAEVACMENAHAQLQRLYTNLFHDIVTSITTGTKKGISCPECLEHYIDSKETDGIVENLNSGPSEKQKN